jgi:hypothetical protein
LSFAIFRCGHLFHRGFADWIKYTGDVYHEYAEKVIANIQIKKSPDKRGFSLSQGKGGLDKN